MDSFAGAKWAQGAVVYHIYPRSFADSNGDGVGDLQGIIAKLDYLSGTLGVNAIWLSPFYPSPMADFGYDISDYCGVDPMFGTLDDFRQLLQAAHHQGIKVIVDFVPNHTSDEHPWFKEARSSRLDPKRNWYIWRDPQDDQPPNNWIGVFGGSAWELDEATSQYYLHSFNVHQPDLNWSNPEVRDAIKQAMRFWLDIGVDGFRLDAVDWMGKHPDMLDEPGNAAYRKGIDHPYDHQRHMHSRGDAVKFSFLAEIAMLLHGYNNRFMVAETYPARHNLVPEYLRFYEAIDPRVAAPFNFEGILLPWQAQQFKGFIDSFQAALQATWIPSYVLGNHDFPRLASRVGAANARSAAVMQLTLPGMPFIYYGEELGMPNVYIAPERVRDPDAASNPNGQGRDPARTPMQWTSGPYAGFSAVEPWLPLAPDYAAVNVESQQSDPHSSLNLYRQLLGLRRASAALRHGSYTPIETTNPNVYMFMRRHGDECLTTAINFTDQPAEGMAHNRPADGPVIVSSLGAIPTTAFTFGRFTLRPHEACVIKSP